MKKKILVNFFSFLFFFFFFFLGGGGDGGGESFRWSSPHELTFTWWGCCGLSLWHKPSELAHYFWFCSCIRFCLYVTFIWYFSFHKVSRQLFAFPFCSSGLIYALLLVLSIIDLFMKVPLSRDILLCGWQVLKHQETNNIRWHSVTCSTISSAHVQKSHESEAKI